MFIQELSRRASMGATTGLQLAQFQAAALGVPVPDEDTWDERRAAIEVERVGLACPSCGLPGTYGDRAKERCPACGAESVADTAHTVKMTLQGLRSVSARQVAMRAIAVHRFPLGKRAEDGTWRCGACAAPLRAAPSGSSRSFERCAACGKDNTGHEAVSMLAMYEAVAAGLATRAELAKVNAKIARISELENALRKTRDDAGRKALVVYALVFAGIALATWIAYRMDLALSAPAPTMRNAPR
jgi:hypothetical protein